MASLAEGCSFTLRSSAVAFQRAFRDSWSQGLAQIDRFSSDVGSRLQEYFLKDKAYFNTPIESRINPLTGKEDLYWQGYKRSIDASMRRNIGFLVIIGASRERIDQAKQERKLWQSIRNRAINLSEGEAIQFLALRTTDAAEGTALQQISRRDGRLVLESQLMPFDNSGQVIGFQDILNQKGEGIGLLSISDNNAVDPAVSWAVQGPAIDFQTELPGMIIEAMSPAPAVSESIAPSDSLTQLMPEMSMNQLIGVKKDVLGLNIVMSANASVPMELSTFTQSEDRGINHEPTSFWWQLIAAQSAVTTMPGESIIDKPAEVLTNELVLPGIKKSEPAGTVPAGKKTVILFQESTRMEFAGQPTKTVFTAKPIEVKREKLPVNPSGTDKPPRKNVTLSSRDRSTKTLLNPRGVTGKEKPVTIIMTKSKIDAVMQDYGGSVAQPYGGIRRQQYKQPAPKIPAWQVGLEPLNDKEIPFWQPNFADFTNNDALVLVVVTTFFLITNTVWQQPEQTFFNSKEGVDSSLQPVAEFS